MPHPCMPLHQLRGLNKDLPTPLYHQLKTILLEAIEAGAWRPDDQLPTEDDLAHQFAVSKMTVRQALRDLSTLGVVRRLQGRGTFVARPEVELGSREFTSFTHEMRRYGLLPSTKVLEKCITEAPPAVAAALLLRNNAPVFRLRRLRLADGIPMGVQCAYLPHELTPGIETLDFSTTSLYQVLDTRYRLSLARAEETHYAVAIPPDLAALLDVPPGSAGLAAHRTAYLPTGRPLEFVESTMRGDRYRIVLDLSARRP